MSASRPTTRSPSRCSTATLAFPLTYEERSNRGAHDRGPRATCGSRLVRSSPSSVDAAKTRRELVDDARQLVGLAQHRHVPRGDLAHLYGVQIARHCSLERDAELPVLAQEDVQPRNVGHRRVSRLEVNRAAVGHESLHHVVRLPRAQVAAQSLPDRRFRRLRPRNAHEDGRQRALRQGQRRDEGSPALGDRRPDADEAGQAPGEASGEEYRR